MQVKDHFGLQGEKVLRLLCEASIQQSSLAASTAAAAGDLTQEETPTPTSSPKRLRKGTETLLKRFCNKCVWHNSTPVER